MPQFTQILKISTISKAQAPYSGPDGKMLRVYCGLAVGRAAEDTRWGHEAIVTPHSAASVSLSLKWERERKITRAENSTLSRGSLYKALGVSGTAGGHWPPQGPQIR